MPIKTLINAEYFSKVSKEGRIMPELPEVETIKRQLEERIVGVGISDIEVLNLKSFVGNKQDAISNKIIRIFRRGKMMVWELRIGSTANPSTALRAGNQQPTNNKNLFLMFRLGMSGQILYEQSTNNNQQTTKNDKHARVVFYLSDGSKIYFRDARKFGRVKLLGDLGDIGDLREEPFNKNFTKEYLKEILQKSKKPIKVFLMEQGRIAGIGNIYANEALFEAGILPIRPANSLSKKETEKLYNSIRKVLSEGIEHQGSSIKDKSYINALGEIGSHQHYLKIYQREGKPCGKCGALIVKIRLGGRGTFFCHKCQK